MRTWQDNATEYDQLIKQGRDARLALLVACSVDASSKGGRPKKNTEETVATETVTEKVSASQFARKAKTTADRVLRHLEAWDKIANSRDALVPLASTLKPSSAETFGVMSDEAQHAFELAYRQIVKDKATPKDEPVETEAPTKAKAKTRKPDLRVVKAEDEEVDRPDEQIFDEPEPDNDFERTEALIQALTEAATWVGLANDHYDKIETKSPDLYARVVQSSQAVREAVDVLLAKVGSKALDYEHAKLAEK